MRRGSIAKRVKLRSELCSWSRTPPRRRIWPERPPSPWVTCPLLNRICIVPWTCGLACRSGLQHRAKLLDRLVRLPLPLEQLPEIVSGLGITRLKLDRALERLEGPGHVARIFFEEAEIVLRFGIIRP